MVQFNILIMKKYLIILTAVLMGACSGNKEGENAGTIGGIDVEGAIKNAESRRKTDPNSSGGNKCLLDYQTKLDQLLTADMVVRATGFSENVMDSSYTQIMSTEYHYVNYSFQNKRKGKVMGLKGEFEVKDEVALRRIKPISLTRFKDSYRVITQEEEQLAKDVFEDVAEGKSGDKQADEAAKQLRESNIDKETVKTAGGALMSTFKEISEGYREEKELGDAARWNVATNELAVLKNGVQFELHVEVSNDKEKNREAAIAIAKEILKKCN